MKILAISDQVVPRIYSSRIRDHFSDVEMVLSCGDLPYSYLEYIVTMLGVPCLFVHGNHDHPEHQEHGSVLHEPGGWVNLDGRTMESKGILLAGLEGSIRYSPHATYQYTQRQMALKAWRLSLALFGNRLFRGRYLDVLIAHAPPLDIHDGKDYAHQGFAAFRKLMARFRPRYLLHGHQHVYTPQACRTQYLDTLVINVHPFQIIEW